MTDKYELFGGILYSTPVDDTSEQIISNDFKKAQSIAEALLNAKNKQEIIPLIKNIDDHIVNYMNSPFIDFMRERINRKPVEKSNRYVEKASFSDTFDNVDEVDDVMDSCFLKSCAFGPLIWVKYFVDRGADVHCDNDRALQWACLYGHFDIVKYLVEECKIDIHGHKDAAPRWATTHGHLNIVKYLVERGADINKSSRTALATASLHGHMDIIKYLLSVGATILLDHRSPLGFAAENNHLDVIKYFVEYGVDLMEHAESIIKYAAVNGHLDIIKYVIEQGYQIKAVDEYDCTKTYEISEAAANGHVHVIKYLVEHGVDLFHDDNTDVETEALEHCQIEVIKYLRSIGKEGVYIDDVTNFLSGTIDENREDEQRSLELAKYLVPEVFAIDSDEAFDILEAAAYYRLFIVKYLVEIGVNVKADNWKIFKKACLYMRLEAVKYFVEECGAPVTEEHVKLAKQNHYDNNDVYDYIKQIYEGNKK